jgi:hypothetical protein
MADITAANVSVDTSTGQFAPQIPDLVAGEALTAGACVYIKSDGKVWLADGSAADALAGFVGIVAKAYAVGRACTVFMVGTRMRYAAGMTPGTPLFLSATAGALADAATTGGVRPIARAITATDIMIISASGGAV